MGVVGVAAGALLIAGCESNSNGPPSTSLAGSETCKSIKAELTRLDAKGVPAYVEAQNKGKKLSAANKADADNYNKLLNDYLGARCHV
jgi:hypothetical protein